MTHSDQAPIEMSNGGKSEVTNQTQADSAVQTRTYNWTDPMADLAAIAGLAKRSGLEQIQAIADGRVAKCPAASLIDGGDINAREGWVEVTMRAQKIHYNPVGTVHGGVLAIMLDTAAGCAVQTTLKPGEVHTTLDLTVKYLRPATEASGLLRCEATVINRGRRTALAQAQVVDEAGRLIAHATSSCMILNPDA
ncbi:PaaI family thioesterase [Nocardia sp. NBC_01730]|uniref:PaaI family thioesterase n=1 Tax=Nocardia sp. NBC_01730 TaxID=2975998 RepID=UPI002E164F71|nr:PaaI family thioesterase [Nocardia sp. NBC_01730]